MSNEMQIRPADQLPDVADPFGGVEARSAAESIFARAHRVLRGRYKWCLLLGTLLAGGLATAAFFLIRVQWASTGVLQVKISQKVVLYLTPESQRGDDTLKETQMALIRSQRVIELAMQSEDWVSLKRRNDDQAINDFRKTLTLDSTPRSEVVFVTFTDPDPKAASAAVKSVLASYNKLYVETEVDNERGTKEFLEARRLTLQNELKIKRDQIDALARTEYGADDIRPLHQAKLLEKIRLEEALAEVNIRLTAQEVAQPGVKGTGPGGKKAPQDLTDEDIEFRDTGMRQIRGEYRQAQAALQRLMDNTGPNHPRVKELRPVVEDRAREVSRYAAAYRAAAMAAAEQQGTPDAILGVGNANSLSTDQLKRMRDRYKTAIEEVQADLLSMGKKMLELEKLKRDAAETDALLSATKTRIDQLNTEGQARIRVLSFGDRAVIAKDSRIALSVVGGLMGMGMGFGIVLLFAVRDRRFRNIDDARTSGRVALLGVLPSLPDDLSDPEQAAIASHCVHQIRTLLQINARGGPGKVFAITSPAAGTGKTSLTLSLGISFAATGARTLIIDCDMMGGGLTARVDTIIRRKIGQILAREGLISPQQLDAALRNARNSQKKLGEVLVEMGMLSREDVARALNVQEASPVGVLEALAGEPITDCITETGIANLYILPLGSARPSDVSKLSPASIRDLLARTREHFDTILIDTGPVPGSLEASVVTAASDGVVMVVSRGEHRPLAERSLQHLHEIGAKVSGMVFNRAEARDVELSATTNRLSSIDRTVPRTARQETEHGDESGRLGPVARAVNSRTTASKPETKA
jgi:Mrp family chromosome partitioning ATPase